MKSISELLKIIDKKMLAENKHDEELSKLLTDILDMSDELAEKNVFNRCFVYHCKNKYSIQKQFKSKEDFILNNPSDPRNGVEYYLQTMVNYPSVERSYFDIDTIENSVISCGGVDIGIEICLDHKRQRLHNYVLERIIPRQDVQIVISCGMQLKEDSVATKQGGILFNCDGEYVLPEDAVNGDDCHSQLKTCIKLEGDKAELSAFKPALRIEQVVYNADDCEMLYPKGLGEIHIYGPMAIEWQDSL